MKPGVLIVCVALGHRTFLAEIPSGDVPSRFDDVVIAVQNLIVNTWEVPIDSVIR